MTKVIRQDDNNHLIQGLHSFLAKKTVDYDAEAVSAQAVLVVAPGGTDDELTFTAVAYGAAGNGISIEYLDPEAAESPLSVAVDLVAKTIVFSLETDTEEAIVTTADEIKTALLADDDASSLVTAADSGGDDGSGVVDAVAADVTADGAGRTHFAVTGDVAVNLIAKIEEDGSGSGALYVTPTDENGALVSLETMSGFGAGEWFVDASGSASVSELGSTFFTLSQDLRDYVITDTVTANITFYLFWYPLSDDGNVEVTTE